MEKIGTNIEEKHAYATIDFTAVTAANVNDLINNGFYSTCCTCDEKYSIRFVNGAVESTGSPNPIINVDINGITSGEELVNQKLSVKLHQSLGTTPEL